MRSQFHRAAVLAGAFAAAFALPAAPARAGFLINDDFDAGIIGYSATGPVSNGTSAVQIRPGTDSLNTGTTAGFDGFFGSSGRFLSLGDFNGALGNGTPAGPVGATTPQVSTARFALGVFDPGSYRLGLSFDFVFDTNLAPGTTQARSPDDFVVTLSDGNGMLLELLRFDDVLRNESGRRGSWSGDVDFTLTSQQPVSLSFSLTEYANAGDSAAGIDNLGVVPIAPSIALLAIGLLGLRSLRRHERAIG
jgi:hypothetical protein